MRRIGNDGYFQAELTNGRVVLGAFHLYDIVNLKKQMVRFKGETIGVFTLVQGKYCLDFPDEISDLLLVSTIDIRERIRAC